MRRVVALYFILISLCLNGQRTTTFPVNGVSDKAFIYTAFVNARIYTDYQTVIPNATLLIKDDKVIEIGPLVSIPKSTVIYDLNGKTIYPSFIDLCSNYGMPDTKKEKPSHTPQQETRKKGAYNWNETIQPERNAEELFAFNREEADRLRTMGFGLVLSHEHIGQMSGTSALVSLAEAKENELIVKGKAANQIAFDKGLSNQLYPLSLMGAVALLRQTYYDAQWYAGERDKLEFNISLEALNRSKDLPQLFRSGHLLNSLRASKIGSEFGINYVIFGDGREYQLIDEVKITKSTFILPVNFPKPYKITDHYDADWITLEEMKHWEMAPSNPKYLKDNGVAFAITSFQEKKADDFKGHLKQIISKGLDSKEVLKALTYIPAKVLRMENEIGSLKKGMLANFLITSGDIFDDGILYENWIQGKKYEVNAYNRPDIRGNYDVRIGNISINFMVEGSWEQNKIKVVQEKDTLEAKYTLEGQLISLSFSLSDGMYRLSGSVPDIRSGIWTGEAITPRGERVDWSAIKTKPFIDKKENDSTSTENVVLEKPHLLFPFSEYGWIDSLPKQQTVLFRGATIWTNTKDSIIKGDVLIRNGKIAEIAFNILAPDNAIVVEAKGKHLTPGIIDEHAHFAINGSANEAAIAVSSEVRIGDVLRHDDSNIYRLLAGGVTTAHILHGSANPIGGQTALIKLRWGVSPEQLKFEDAPPFIKLALGENVKQSNWGDEFNFRFPQTRMGVEQVYYDAFTQAKEYSVEQRMYAGLSNKAMKTTPAPRKNLRLEPLVEVLNKKRFVTCHSYVQSEMRMAISVADSFGFTLNTFTHGLEAYKLRDRIKAHGAGVSTFSDWWAYKYEVKDAIPYNASLLNKDGICVALNSDDEEMGRRLNQEAAKMVKYGNVSEVDALKMITLNPAKLLHIDDRVGSIKVGMDADVVLWSSNPLSVYAKAEKVFIDGICYFDQEEDQSKREYVAKERNRLLIEMMKEEGKGASTQSVTPKKEERYGCNEMEE